MDTKEIILEEDTMEEIRKIANQTGENPNELAEHFENFLEDLLAQTPPEIVEMQRRNRAYAENFNPDEII